VFSQGPYFPLHRRLLQVSEIADKLCALARWVVALSHIPDFLFFLRGPIHPFILQVQKRKVSFAIAKGSVIMSGKRTFGGDIERHIAAELQAMQKGKLLSRLWARDATLWPQCGFETTHIQKNLEFLHIPESLPQLMADGLTANLEAMREGMTEKILISFGSVHHFCRAVQEAHPEGNSLPLRFLESCHPDALRRVREGLDPGKMFVILVNKSGYRLEDHALFLYFHKLVESEGRQKAGKHFAAATDPGSYLAEMANEYGFRHLLKLPVDVSAPFCSILFLGLFLIAVIRVEPEVLRMTCREMRKQSLECDEDGENPALELAAFLAGAAKSGRKLLRFVTAAKQDSFAMGVCRLVGGSLGRENGVFPFVSRIPGSMDAEQKKESCILFESGEAEASSFEAYKNQLKSRGTPFLSLKVENALELVRQSFSWQVATVLSAAQLGIYPFEPPDVLMGQELAGEMLNQHSPGQDMLHRKSRVQEGSLQLFAEAKARREISQLNLIESLRSFFQRRASASYLSLFVFLEQREDTEDFFDGLGGVIEANLGLPVILAWGPRSMDTYSFLLREEAPAGLHLLLTGEPQAEVSVPGAYYKFGQLHQALALGQFEALSRANGLALRLHMGTATRHELAGLENVVMQALRRSAG
jgi:glucose-6-phosphate isomerase